tara:strand:+ start:1552 stop:1818 length:267 start_codon:yes stop_codon:yes gene_type:complete
MKAKKANCGASVKPANMYVGGMATKKKPAMGHGGMAHKKKPAMGHGGMAHKKKKNKKSMSYNMGGTPVKKDKSKDTGLAKGNMGIRNK